MKLALFGNGGHAKEVAAQLNDDVTFFVDDEFVGGTAKSISEFDPNVFKIMIAVSNSADRQKILNKLPKESIFFTFVHPSAKLLNNVNIGIGSFVGANSVLTTDIKIGKHAIINRGVHIGHDCCIGDFFSIMPGAIISGDCRISNNVFVGANSTVKEKLFICENVVFGLNSGIVNDILSSGTYVGTPANKINN